MDGRKSISNVNKGIHLALKNFEEGNHICENSSI